MKMLEKKQEKVLLTREIQEMYIDVLHELRNVYGLTVEQLAKHLEITTDYLKKIFAFKRSLTKTLIERIKVLDEQYARKQSLQCLVDYIHVVFPTRDWKRIVTEVLGLNVEWFKLSEKTLYNYDKMFEFDEIKILQCKDEEEYHNMGCLVILRGMACRQFERFLDEQQKSWFEFLEICFNYDGKFTRIDLAVDDYKEYLALDELVLKIEKNEIQTSFKKIKPLYDIVYDLEKKERVRQGVTIYFGSRQSDLQVCLYQKNYQLAKKQNRKVTDFEVKNRYEVRFLKGLANDVARLLVFKKDVYSVTLGVLAEKIMFLDSFQSAIWKKWEQFLYGVDKIKLVKQPENTSYVKMLRYARNNFGKVLKTLLEIDYINGTSVLDDILLDLDPSDKQRQVMLSTVENKDYADEQIINIVNEVVGRRFSEKLYKRLLKKSEEKCCMKKMII